MENFDNNTTTAVADFTKTVANLLSGISDAGSTVGGPIGRTTDLAGIVGDFLGNTADGTKLYTSDDPWRDFFGLVGGGVGAVAGVVILPITTEAGLVVGAVAGSAFGPAGTFAGAIIGGASFGAAGIYFTGEAGSAGMEAFYDYINSLPKFQELTDAQRVELAQMIKAGVQPWEYQPNGDSDLVYDPKNIIPNTPTDSTPLNPKDGHPFAPLPPLQRRDPLVLDMNKDGLISTVSLADSTAFFDLTGDGIKEKVGWVQASEGIVAFDKNGNGKIDGISEVFGTATTSGFDELRTLADSNYDNVIDRRDELYNQLKVWQEEVNCEARETTLGCTNQDGISQASELKSLSQAGVNNIELNVFATNINLNGNLLTEAGRYGDTTGTRSLAADVELTFDSRITTVDTSLIPDYTVHADAASLPKLRGYGTVYNSEIAYNVNYNLRNLAITMSADITQVANHFDDFMAEWSGLNTMLRMVNNQNCKKEKVVA